MARALISRDMLRQLLLEHAEQTGAKIKRVQPGTLDDIAAIAKAAVMRRIKQTVEQNRQHVTCKPAISTEGMFPSRRRRVA